MSTEALDRVIASCPESHPGAAYVQNMAADIVAVADMIPSGGQLPVTQDLRRGAAAALTSPKPIYQLARDVRALIVQAKRYIPAPVPPTPPEPAPAEDETPDPDEPAEA